MDAKVSEKGQIVIPAELRKKYGIAPGVMVRIVDTGNGLLLKPITKESIEAMRGVLHGSGVVEALLAERAKDIEREG